MKKKLKTEYVCTNCGQGYAKWAGRCSNCGEWNTLTEEVVVSGSKKSIRKTGEVVRLGDISHSKEFRIKTNIGEFDRVLGGGLVPGSIVLAGGDPGIGKSTLLLQTCGNLTDENPLYITGEESLKQIRYRSARLEGINEDLKIMAETDIDTIINAIKQEDCGFAVVDSIQSVFSQQIDAAPGSMVQVRECAAKLMQCAKETGKAIILIGHVTKEGIIAGPKILEHMVDTVLQFEGDKSYTYRMLRSQKNRFGSTNEIGIFEMTKKGMRQVLNPSEIFLLGREHNEPGIAIVAALEGTRPILIEVQALVTPTSYGVPQRTVNGYDLRRLQMILAVMEKRLGMDFRHSDVFINIAGGMKLNDTSIDLGIAAALVSSAEEKAVDDLTVFSGEIGLTGEVRSVMNIEQRIVEAEKLGFKYMIIPSFKELNKSKYNINLKISSRIYNALSNAGILS